MNPGIPFLVVGLGEAWLSTLLPWWGAWLFAWAGASTSYVALAYFLRRPELLGKRHAPGVSLAALLPFHLAARGSAIVARRWIPERVEVAPGLWVGGWPRRGAPGLCQLDLTAELPRRGDAVDYACVPMLDGAPPEPDAWRAAVEQAVAWRARGHAVLVHCAYGHGRSVAVVIGVLVAEGIARTWEEAHATVLAVRPLAKMTPAQRRMLAETTVQWRAAR